MVERIPLPLGKGSALFILAAAGRSVQAPASSIRRTGPGASFVKPRIAEPIQCLRVRITAALTFDNASASSGMLRHWRSQCSL